MKNFHGKPHNFTGKNRGIFYFFCKKQKTAPLFSICRFILENRRQYCDSEVLNMRNKKFDGSAIGKGYYIALILCAVAIGISGYMYYRNANRDKQMNQAEPVISATAAPVQEDDVPVLATQPQTAPQTRPQPSESAEPRKLETVVPVDGQVIAAFAMEELQYNQTTRDWRVHNGVDLAAEEGTEVRAAAEGEVYTVYDDETMGTTVVLRHADGYITKYASLDEDVAVTPGQQVAMGQTIGCVGQTALLESAIGTHVHFSVTLDGEPVDPAQFLG